MNPVIVRNVHIGQGIPKICVPIIATTREEILEAAQKIAHSSADMVEWRVDWFESVQEMQKVVGLSAELRQILGEIPILFTFRTKAEGGEKELHTRAYVMLNKMMIASGNIDLVDVEVYTAQEAAAELVETAHKHGVKVVGSNHDFLGTPEKDELVRRLCYMQSIGVDIPKIAVMPKDIKDVLLLLEATHEMKTQYADRPIVTMSMSRTGLISRVAGEIFGADITFGTLGNASAPGQIPVEDLRKMLEIMHTYVESEKKS